MSASLTMARMVLAILVTVVALAPGREIARVRQTNVDQVADALATRAAPEDLVVVTPWYYGITFSRYARGPWRWTTLPPIADLSVTRWDLVRASMTVPDVVAPISERVRATLAAGHRVWIVGNPAIPRPGSERPVPPVAPHPVWGWSSDPCTDRWSQQPFHDVRAVGARIEAVPIGSEASVLELARVFLVTSPGPADSGVTRGGRRSNHSP